MNEEYKNIIKNQNLNELDKKDIMSIIFKNLDDIQWYFLNNEEQSEYNEKIVKFLNENYKNFDLNDTNFEKILQKIIGTNLSQDLKNYLWDNSLNSQKILISPNSIYLNSYPMEEQIEYIKVLNKNDYIFFEHLEYRIEPKWNSSNKLLEKVYEDFFFASKENDKTKIIPCDSYNKLILIKNTSLFLNNELINNELTQKNIKELCEKHSKHISILLTNVFNTDCVNKFFKNKLEILLENIFANDKISNEQKQQILWDTFKNKINEKLGDALIDVLTNNEIIKINVKKLLNSKINENIISSNHYIKDVLAQGIKNINLAQGLMITGNIPLFQKLIKNDKEYKKILNKTIHMRINNYDYEKNIFDIALLPSKSVGLIKFGKNIRLLIKVNLLENNKNKDKYSTILFKQLTENNPKDAELEILSLLESVHLSSLKKNLKIFKDNINSNHIQYINNIITFKELDTNIKKSDHNHKSVKKMKI